MTNSWQVDPKSEAFVDAFSTHLERSAGLDAVSLQRGRRAARQTNDRFDRVLPKLGLLSEDALCRELAAFLSLELAEPFEPLAAEVCAELAPLAFYKSHRMAPLALSENEIVIGVADPFEREAIDAFSFKLKRRPVLRLATATRIDASLQRMDAGRTSDTAAGVPVGADDASDADLQRLRDIANEAPTIRLVSQLVNDAVEARSSDIHIEPTEDAVQVRFRVDGELRNASTLPVSLKSALSSRIKILAGLDIAERRLPQDGRTRMAVRGVDIDFRVSTLPTSYGESIVLRILDRSRVSLDFTALGFREDEIALFQHLASLPHGIVLVTGPTGSGKTTSLYAALRMVARPQVKVITVEDPVEYQLKGVNQVQVLPSIGMDFPRALRSILRQDPDVIMIGEIRDAETARIAVQASLTGHLVFSTLHTNSAASSITRLLDMGIEHYLISSTVRAVVAQRLVRKLCVSCSAPSQPSAEELKYWASRRVALGPSLHRRAVGCAACAKTGYSGRTTLAEMLTNDQSIQALLARRADDREIEAVARQNGMATLYESGLKKVWAGETTLEEVVRVTQME